MHGLIRKIFEDKESFSDLLRYYFENPDFEFPEFYWRVIQKVCDLPHVKNIGPNYPFNIIIYFGGRFIVKDRHIKTQKRWYEFYPINRNSDEYKEIIEAILKVYKIPYYRTEYFPQKYELKGHECRRGYKEAMEYAKSQVWEDHGLIVSQYDSARWGTMWFNTKYKSEIESILDDIGLKYDMVVSNEL